jgi:hypothetical protein
MRLCCVEGAGYVTVPSPMQRGLSGESAVGADCQPGHYGNNEKHGYRDPPVKPEDDGRCTWEMSSPSEPARVRKRDCAPAALARTDRAKPKLTAAWSAFALAAGLPSRSSRRERRLVRVRGLEPPRRKTLEPKSSASTSSATPARSLELLTSQCLAAGKGEFHSPLPVVPPSSR